VVVDMLTVELVSPGVVAALELIYEIAQLEMGLE